MIIKDTAIIATVFNEARSIKHWLGAIACQTMWPQEIVIVDGGSTDRTVEIISAYDWPVGFPVPNLIVRKCNIAEGRNIAIMNCRANLIASTDAGSHPHPEWFFRIVSILIKEKKIDVVGGRCISKISTQFQERYKKYLASGHDISLNTYSPSSRNTAFRRTAWESVGGYPEWLTLTAEDSLFNLNLHAIGCNYYHESSAVVLWDVRPNLKSYLKMMYSYGYGSAETHDATRQYIRCIVTTFIPLLIIFSLNPIRDIPFRYLRNSARALGWIAGKLSGKKHPKDWKYIKGVLLSPESQVVLKR